MQLGFGAIGTVLIAALLWTPTTNQNPWVTVSMLMLMAALVVALVLTLWSSRWVWRTIAVGTVAVDIPELGAREADRTADSRTAATDRGLSGWAGHASVVGQHSPRAP